MASCPHILSLPSQDINADTKFIKFKEYINQWFELICKYDLCVYVSKKVSESLDYSLGFDPFTENGFTFLFLASQLTCEYGFYIFHRLYLVFVNFTFLSHTK